MLESSLVRLVLGLGLSGASVLRGCEALLLGARRFCLVLGAWCLLVVRCAGEIRQDNSGARGGGGMLVQGGRGNRWGRGKQSQAGHFVNNDK